MNASVERLITQVSNGSKTATIEYHLPTVTIGERINPLGKRLRAGEFLENDMKLLRNVAIRKADAGNRTPDLLITSEPLCHLSYVGMRPPAPA